MYGIFTYIWLIFMVNVGKYTIHGWYGHQHNYHMEGKSRETHLAADALASSAWPGGLVLVRLVESLIVQSMGMKTTQLCGDEIFHYYKDPFF